MSRRLTEVAKKAGVSEATVSRVLNGRSGVAEATRAAVLTAVDVLGYERPSSLRSQGRRLVGLLLPELENPIFPALAEVIGGALVRVGLMPVLCVQPPTGIAEGAQVEMLLDQHVSGLIFVGGNYAGLKAPHEHYFELAERSMPVVLINAGSDALDFPRVSTDDAVALEQAYGHLSALGHQRIGLIVGPEDHVPSLRKVEAYRRLQAETSKPAESASVEWSGFTLEAGRAAATRLIRRGVTGIVCGSDPLALGAIRAVRRAGQDVPRDVSVVGFDDSVLMTCTDPPLTTVRQPIEALGRAAVSVLVGLIEGAPAATEELLFEPELVVRGSTGPSPDRRRR